MINNPILNNPYQGPLLYYATDSEGSLNYQNVRKGRRIYTLDIHSIPQRQGLQPSVFDINELAPDYGEHLINIVRKEVKRWRYEGYRNTTRVTNDLLHFWFENPERHPTKRLFFAQREAVETAIWLNEVAEPSNAGTNTLNKISAAYQTVSSNTENQLPRIVFKMATGTGKTVVMATLILYHYFNRQEYRNDTRFADYFLLVAPGITIKDRLGVLRVDVQAKHTKDAHDYYRERELVSQKYQQALEGLNSRLVIVNYHQFEPKTLQGNKRSPLDGKIKADGTRQEAKEDFSQVARSGVRVGPNIVRNRRVWCMLDTHPTEDSITEAYEESKRRWKTIQNQ
jgi:type III restriction enzyme